MLNHIFENRNKKLTNLMKLGDYLGRSLRENVELFKVSERDKTVSYVTESGNIVIGEYDLDKTLSITNITIEPVELYQDDDKFEDYVQGKVSTFVRSLYENNIGDADINFGDILDSWNERIRFDKTSQKLNEKISKFGDNTNIVGTPEFSRFIEIAPQILSFLQENKEDIIDVPEIKNAVKLSEVVSKAFDIPRLNYTTLLENGSYEVEHEESRSVYDMICQQELIKKDLLESKKQFDGAWATHNTVRSLGGLVYENDTQIAEGLATVIEEVPYFAFTTKKQISNTVKNALSIVEDKVSIPEKDLQKFVAKIFEMKKDIKKELTTILNEKYGVRIQNLKEPPTFKSLINTQVLIFEMLSRMSPAQSVQRETLKDVAKMLKEKSGVQGIDVNDCLRLLFEKAEYVEFLGDEELLNQPSLIDILHDVEAEGDLISKMNVEVPVVSEPSEPIAEDAEESAVAEPEAVEEEEDESTPIRRKNTKTMSKREYLDALHDLEEVLDTIGSQDEDDIEEAADDDDEAHEKYGGNKGDIPDKDRKKKGHHGKGPKRKETAEEEDEEDYDDDDEDGDEEKDKKGKKEKSEKDREVRSQAVKDLKKDAKRKNKKFKDMPDELGSDDD